MPKDTVKTIHLTDRQAELWASYKEIGSYRGVARRHGLHNSTVCESIGPLVRGEVVAAEHGSIVPVGMKCNRATIQAKVNEDGSFTPIQVWSKSKADDMMLPLNDMKDALLEGLKPRKAIKKPKVKANGNLNQYTLTDAHIGMKAWDQETGANWDLDIAVATILESFSDMISRSPDAEVAILAQIGDFFHYDSLDAVTPLHKNLLDADGRAPLMVRAGMMVIDGLIEMLLKKYLEVWIVFAEGNHDLSMSMLYREMLAHYLSKNKRVKVNTGASPYYHYVWGDNLLCYHHGHLARKNKIDQVFMSDPTIREEIGRTRQTYIHTGHLHHSNINDTGLAVVEVHSTLAAPDAYASRNGYRNLRKANCITYHKSNLETGRIVHCI